MDQATAALLGAVIGGGLIGGVTIAIACLNARWERKKHLRDKRLETLEELHRHVARLANSDLRVITPEIRDMVSSFSTVVAFVRVYFHPHAEPPNTQFAQAIDRFEQAMSNPIPNDDVKFRTFQDMRNEIRALARFALND